MTDDKKTADIAFKRFKAGMYAPEDFTPNEYRCIRKYYPSVGEKLKRFYERRQDMIISGEWDEGLEPPDNSRRIKRYERGEGIVSPEDWKDG